MRGLRFLAVLSAVLLLKGCVSWEVVQNAVFTDVDGRVIGVKYGQAEEYHASEFISPGNGKKAEFRSRLLVEVITYDGDGFRAWQTFNPLASGTMYRSDDGRWMFLAGGMYCMLMRQDPTRFDKYGQPDYRIVFEGVMGKGKDK